MANAQTIVNKLLEASPGAPEHYINWLAQKHKVGRLENIRFGVRIHTTDEDVIQQNAIESGALKANARPTDARPTDADYFWYQVIRNLRVIEANAEQILREAGFYVNDEGHDEDRARVASVWIMSQPIGEPNTPKQIKLTKDIVSWADNADWPSTNNGNLDQYFGLGTTEKLYSGTSDESRFIDVTFEFTGTDALAEWLKINIVEAVGPDDPNLFLTNLKPRLKCNLIIDHNFHVTGQVDSVYKNVDAAELLNHTPRDEIAYIVRECRWRENEGAENPWRYQVSAPWTDGRVRAWLEKIVSPKDMKQASDARLDTISWLSFTKEELYNYVRMAHPKVKLKEAVNPADDPKMFFNDYLQRLKNEVMCSFCGNTAAVDDNGKTHPSDPIQFSRTIETAMYPGGKKEWQLEPGNIEPIQYFKETNIYHCKRCNQDFVSDLFPVVESADNPDDPATFLRNFNPFAEFPALMEKLGFKAVNIRHMDRAYYEKVVEPRVWHVTISDTQPMSVEVYVGAAFGTPQGWIDSFRFTCPIHKLEKSLLAVGFGNLTTISMDQLDDVLDDDVAFKINESVDEAANPADDPETFLKTFNPFTYVLKWMDWENMVYTAKPQASLEKALKLASDSSLHNKARSIWIEKMRMDVPVHTYEIDNNYEVEPTSSFNNLELPPKPPPDIIEGLNPADDPEMFIKKWRPRWTLISHLKNHHFFFKDEFNRIAVADYSMRRQTDPASSDDGLLILNPKKPIKCHNRPRYTVTTKYYVYSLPIIPHIGGLEQPHTTNYVTINKPEMDDLWPKIESLGFRLEMCEANEKEMNPRAYIDYVYGWTDVFRKEGMTADPGRRGQFYKKFQIKTNTDPYSIYVNTVYPLWLIVQHYDYNGPSLSSRHFSTTFDFAYKDRNGLVEAFQYLNKLLTDSVATDFHVIDHQIRQYQQEHKLRRDRFLRGEIKEDAGADDPATYLRSLKVYTMQEIKQELERCGLSFYRNHFLPWGRWVVINGFSYWTLEEPYEPFFREQLEKFCKEMGFTVYHIQITEATPHYINFRLAIPKIQVHPKSLEDQNLWGLGVNKEKHDIAQRAWLPEAVNPDDPAMNIERFAAAINPANILEPLGFSVRRPTWNCADPQYKWWERFTGGLKWTVIRKSDDRPHDYEVNISKPRLGQGADYEQVHGFTCSIKELDAKLRDAFQKAHRFHEPVEEAQQVDLLQQFVALNLPGAPTLKVQQDVSCNDIDRINGPQECLPVAVVSTDTMQKYIVPRNDGFLVPVPHQPQEHTGPPPEGQNWDIIKLTTEQLGQIIQTPPASLDNFYRLALETGALYRRYYEGKLPPEDDPATNVQRYMQHVQKTEADAIKAVCDRAIARFEKIINRYNVETAAEADRLAIQIGKEQAEYADYREGSKEFNAVIMAVYNRGVEMFPDAPDEPVEEAKREQVDYPKAKQMMGVCEVSEALGPDDPKMLFNTYADALAARKAPQPALQRLGFQYSTTASKLDLFGVPHMPEFWHKRYPKTAGRVLFIRLSGGESDQETYYAPQVTLPVTLSFRTYYIPSEGINIAIRNMDQLITVISELDRAMTQSAAKNLTKEQEKQMLDQVAQRHNPTVESVPLPPEDEPEQFLKTFKQPLLTGELTRLEFEPYSGEHKVVVYGGAIVRLWGKYYTATDGTKRIVYVRFNGGDHPEVTVNNYNHLAQTWYGSGNSAPPNAIARTEPHLCAIVRDIDDAMKRSAADSLPPDQERDALARVMKHHNQWWDDLLSSIDFQGGIPGRIGPGEPA